MTLNQLEKRIRQLLYRKRLADTIEPLEDGIKAHMQVEEKEQIRTKSFVICFLRDELSINVLPKVDPRQLRLKLGRES
jgi:hypothetical protein